MRALSNGLAVRGGVVMFSESERSWPVTRRMTYVVDPLQLLLIFWLENVLRFARNHFIFCTILTFTLTRIASSCDMYFLRGLKIEMSRGWVKCEEGGGKLSSLMLLFMQCSIKSPVTWLPWPSHIKTRGFSPAFWRIWGSNNARS